MRPRWGELKPHDEFIDRKNRCWLVRSIAPAKTEGMVIVVAECAETGETRTLFGRVGNEVGVLW